MTETYISIDVEATGPVPGLFHMLELGACAILPEKPRMQCVETFGVSLRLDHGDYHPGDMCAELDCTRAGWDPDTWNWWHGDADRLATLCTIEEDAISSHDAMHFFRDWISKYEKPVIVGYPSAYDFAWLNYYWWKHVGVKPPFSHSSLDIKTLAMTVSGVKYRETSKRSLSHRYPDIWSGIPEHTHRADADAKEQAWIFLGLMVRAKWLRDFRTNVSTALSVSGPDEGFVEVEQIKFVLERLKEHEELLAALRTACRNKQWTYLAEQGILDIERTLRL